MQLVHQYQSGSDQIKLYRKAAGLALSINQDQVYSFEHSGRPISLFQKGVFYQRGLDHRLLKKYRDTTGLHRVLVDTPVKKILFQKLYQRIQQIQNELKIDSTAHPAQELIQTLQQFNPTRLEAEGQTFAQVYKPISILPPDQYLSVVLQLTEGCSYNRCSFCNFYKDRPFRIKSPPEFQTHIQEVTHFLDTSLTYRKSIFLADGDALMTPQARLLECLQLLHSDLPNRPIYSFMDAFRPQAKTQQDFEQLVAMGLKKVYLGIETAHPPLLAFLEKPGTPDLMATEALKMKKAGLDLGLIFMVGVGGESYREAHFKASLNWLKALPLTAKDSLFLSEFIAHPDQAYLGKAKEAQILPLSTSSLKEEVKRWKQALKPLGPQIVPYHLQEFLY